MATLGVSVWAWLSDLKRQPGSQWVLASQRSVCPGLRTSPWEAPSRPRGPFQGVPWCYLVSYFSPDLAAGFPGLHVNSRFAGRGAVRLGWKRKAECPQLWHQPSQICTRPAQVQAPSPRWPPPASWDTARPGGWTIRDCPPPHTHIQGPQSLRMSRSPQNLSLHHWARTPERRRGHPPKVRRQMGPAWPSASRFPENRAFHSRTERTHPRPSL